MYFISFFFAILHVTPGNWRRFRLLRRWISHKRIQMAFVHLCFNAQEWGCNGNMEVDIICISTGLWKSVNRRHESAQKSDAGVFNAERALNGLINDRLQHQSIFPLLPSGAVVLLCSAPLCRHQKYWSTMMRGTNGEVKQNRLELVAASKQPQIKKTNRTQRHIKGL